MNVQSGERLLAEIPMEQAYVHSLKQHSAFVHSSTLREFVLQDVASNGSLKPHKYVVVKRLIKSFLGQSEWLYSCSCDRSNSAFVHNLEHSQDIAYSEFIESSDYRVCIHVCAAKTILNDLDAIHSIAPELDIADHSYGRPVTELEPPQENAGINISLLGDHVVVEDGGTLGVLTVARTGIRCCLCRSKPKSCRHVKSLQAATEDPDTPVRDVLEPLLRQYAGGTDHNEQYKCMSKTPIQFVLTDNQKSNLRRQHMPYPTVLQVDQTQCPYCSAELYLYVTEGVIITTNDIIQVNVQTKECSLCSRELYYDGNDDCLLNINNCVMLSHELLRRYMFGFLLGRHTLFTEYSVLKETFADRDVLLEAIMPYVVFKKGWYSYLALLDISFSSAEFCCPLCGTFPELLLMDGTDVGIRQELLKCTPFSRRRPSNSLPPSCFIVCTSGNDTLHHSGIHSAEEPLTSLCRFSPSLRVDVTPLGQFKERVAIPDSKARRLLRCFSTSTIGTSEYGELMSVLPVEFQGVLRIAKDGEKNSIKKEWSEFMRILWTSSPVCAAFPVTSLERMKRCLHTTLILHRPKELKFLQDKFPVLGRLVRHLGDFTPELKEAVGKLISIVESMDTQVTDIEYSQPEGDPLSFFPMWPQLRQRPMFEADRKLEAASSSCRETCGYGHKSLTPGVFNVLCQHGISYGFELMALHESPNNAFTLLWTRWPEAPKMVVYDFACKLQEYCLDRDSSHFGLCQMKVDSFHWYNHKACSPAYRLKDYSEFQHLNSQAVAHFNAGLQRLTSSLSDMNKENLFNHVKLYSWYHNQRRLKSLPVLPTTGSGQTKL